MVAGPTYRITVLTPGLVRLGHAADGVLEERASAFALNRQLPVPEFTVVETTEGIEVLPDRFVVSCDRGPFTTSGLPAPPLCGDHDGSVIINPQMITDPS